MISSQDITANDIGGNIKLALEGSAGERTAQWWFGKSFSGDLDSKTSLRGDQNPF